MKKYILSILAAATVGIFSASSASAKQCDVSITEMSWASAQVVTAVAKFIMENGYGCEVAVVPSSTVPAVTSVAETGKPDIVTELWVLSSAVYPKLEAEGKVKTAGKVLTDGGVEGWWIPKYLADKHPELKTIDGVLANPDKVGARFHNCPSGWACEIINNNLAKAFDLAGQGIEVFNHGSGETLAASIGSAYESKEPWFGYYWAPTAILGKYDMVKVDVGAHDAERFACVAQKDCANPQPTDYANSLVITSVTTDFASKNPEVYKLMTQFGFSNKVMGEILSWKQAKSASTDEAAVYFIQNYKDVWSSWLSNSARRKLAKLL